MLYQPSINQVNLDLFEVGLQQISVNEGMKVSDIVGFLVVEDFNVKAIQLIKKDDVEVVFSATNANCVVCGSKPAFIIQG
jgi:hypothetical protein